MSDQDRVLTLADAAELVGSTKTALRKRADRGQLQTVMRAGVRCVPYAELVRAGLAPGAEVEQLRARVAALEGELRAHRLLTERAESQVAQVRRQRDAEMAAHAATAEALQAQRAAAIAADAQLAALANPVRPDRWLRHTLRRRPAQAATGARTGA